MAYEVIARKWRPQKFDDVVGQEHVTQTLKNAIASDRVAHAYLFVGPRGVGKTSTARIFAKALNCEKGPTATPCDKCDSCREIMAGNNLDVLEIDAASNTGVDNVRDLRDNVRYAPSRGPFKIYIIDEVHMLSTAAFNALLKTLEEPPKHVKFVFATTEPQKVPATILSRCQRFDLRRISVKDIVKRLSEVAEAEKLEIDEDAMLAIARGAEGGLRDAESALDQLIAFRGKNIKEEDVLSVFGLVARHTLDELALAVVKGNIVAAIKLIAEMDEGGKDIQRVILELLEHFRNVLVCLYAGETFVGLDLTEGQVEIIKEHASLTDPARLLRVVDILSETENRMRYALSRRTLLETALIRASRVAKVVTIDEIMNQLESLKRALSGQGGLPPSELPLAKAPAPEKATYSEPVKAKAPAVVAETREPPAKPVAGDELGVLSEKWREVVERVGHTAALAKSYLIDAKPVKIVGSQVSIGFDPEFAANKEKIDFARNRKAIEKIIGEVLRREVTVDFCVLDARSTLPGDIKTAGRTSASKTQPGEQPGSTTASLKTKQEWMKNATVRKTLEMFNGDVTDVRK
jgi:DNA polymerase-3 subunit gamma/tau